ncbi:Myelin-associated neurite-outgrowth inhibitor [Varanus komodoensis]|nr:Myelin-associated neurite-outgrowth inhibitor [Varanus komodoensis]
MLRSYPAGYPTAAPTYNPNMYPTTSPGYAPGKHPFGKQLSCTRLVVNSLVILSFVVFQPRIVASTFQQVFHSHRAITTSVIINASLAFTKSTMEVPFRSTL